MKKNYLYIFIIALITATTIIGIQFKQEKIVKCPVDNKIFSAKDTVKKVVYKGKTFHLCGDGCLTNFNEKPDYYHN